jgi:hypothetical protein
MAKIKYDSTRGGWCYNEIVGPFIVGVWKCMRGKDFSLDLSDMRWEIGRRSSFGMLCGVRTIPRRHLFRNCLRLLVVRRLGG